MVVLPCAPAAGTVPSGRVVGVSILDQLESEAQEPALFTVEMPELGLEVFLDCSIAGDPNKGFNPALPDADSLEAIECVLLGLGRHGCLLPFRAVLPTLEGTAHFRVVVRSQSGNRRRGSGWLISLR
jgi:hypothetical protein